MGKPCINSFSALGLSCFGIAFYIMNSKHPQTPSLNPCRSASTGLYKWLWYGFVMSVTGECIGSRPDSGSV